MTVNSLEAGNIEGRQQEQEMESENLDLMAGNECKELPTTVKGLHMECTQSKDLIESANKELLSINQTQGDFSTWGIDTRIKERPANHDIQNINRCITALTKRESVSAKNRPFDFLWIASCVLYAVVIAFFLFSKRWKKRPIETGNR